MRAFSALVLALCVTAGAFGLSDRSHAQSAADWDKVVSDAKKEGVVVVYSAFIGSPQTPEVAKLFQAKYGIKVEILDGRPTEIHERIRAEAAANRAIGDVNLNGSTTLALLREAALLQQHPPIPNAKKLTIEPSAADEMPIFVNAYGLLINTKLVPPGDEPKSWQDILDPKWKGKILADQMSATGAGATLFGVLQDKFGTEFHEKLAKQNLIFSRTIRENPRRVARGEFAMYLPLIVTEMGTLEGLPVKAIVPQEGLAYTPFALAMIKNAPHPNATRLFMNFYLEPEVQLIYARAGYPIAIGGLEKDVPEKWRWSVGAKLMGRQKLEGQQERMTLTEKIYGTK